ncbi:MAG: tetratricopeptide repeat protein [Terracidiphilus sp.]
MKQKEPRGTEGLLRTALAHHRAGRLSEAEQAYREILAHAPHHADSLHLLGMVAFQSGMLDDAAELIRKAIAVHAKGAAYHANLGNVLQAQDKLEEAAASYRHALAIKPNLAEVHLNLGNVLKAQNKVDECVVCYQRALSLQPDLAEAAVAEAMALLLKGDYAAGWKGLETRWQTREFETPWRAYPQPVWKGEPLGSGRLLIWGEQGIGDEIMFAGLIPDALAIVHELVLDCDARLRPLFARSFLGATVLAGCDPQQAADLRIAAQMPSGSLPGVFRGSFPAFANRISPYLVADPLERERLRARYADGRKQVGLAWRTRNQKTGRRRSIELAMFAALFGLEGVRWVSLQYGDPDELEHEARAAGAPLLVDKSVDQLADIDCFAAQVAAMDLVITIDNSTAHVAGALGVPTWLLLPFAPDWRWLLEREDSPWYPTVRLFRQPRHGDWDAVMEAVRRVLVEGTH